MTEYKFRGKSIETGEWVYGYGMIYEEENDIYQIIHRQAQNLTQHTQVDPKTLGQYTGRKDKNGVEIYKGDIAKCSDIDGNYYKTKVYDYEGVLCIDVKGNDDYEIQAVCWAINHDIYEIEVIGNIHTTILSF